MKFKTLIDSEALYKRIKETALEINNDYKDNETLDVVCILKGAYAFFAELTKYLKMPVRVHFLTLSSYGNNTFSSGNIEGKVDLPEFKKALIVEDIVDTGHTMNYLLKNIKARDIKLAVLLDKKCARKVDVKVDYRCFEIEDKFVVGFGMDYQGLYRNLDYIAYL